jgi:phenylalanine-4-hydroxylase
VDSFCALRVSLSELTSYDWTVGQSSSNVPAHLRRFVVEQDYSQYTAVDRAVWRFLLLQIQARLADATHPAYREGLAATGISPERIPSIVEMNDRLSRFGWGAVCVDGFIPPRAFQEFQEYGLLPIAAELRTREHLVYTPAPDIFHEAAGHAPILPDPVFAAYLRRMGDLGKKAFTVPEEDRLYRVIHTLSQKKEDPSLSPDEIARAEAELLTTIEGLPPPSEGARLSRLYWWTAEYGLVGKVDDYKLFGAGLLSSLGESHSCHAPSVLKIPLDERCTEVSYDITRPQPQLFVARSFEQLHDVLDRAARDLAVNLAGTVALERALASRELASVRFSSGAWVIGILAEAGPGVSQPAWLTFSGPAAFAWDGVIRSEGDRLDGVEELVVLTGRLADGGAVDRVSGDAIDAARNATTGRHQFRFATGARVEGRMGSVVRHDDGRLMHLEMFDVQMHLPGRPPRALARYVLFGAGEPVTAHAGAVDPRFHRDTDFSPTRLPRPRTLVGNELELLKLYQQAERAHHMGSEMMRTEFPRVHAALVRDQPHEWLLRWNLLESLLRIRRDDPLTRNLHAELERLEVELDYNQPIASGLSYLSRLAK